MLQDMLVNRLSEKIAIKFGDISMSYTSWFKSSYTISTIIKNNMSSSSLTVALFLPNSINYAVAYFGVLLATKVIVPIGVQSKKTEILSTLEYCESDIIIIDSANKDYILYCLSFYEHNIKVFVIDTNEIIAVNNNKDFVKKSDSLMLNGTETDVAIMLHTSGTTSNPKRVMLTHKNLISNVESNIESLGLTEEDKVLISLPMFFGYCNTAQFLTHIYLGASVIILDSMFLPNKFFQIVEKERITNFTGVPSTLLMLLDYRYHLKYDYSSLRYICFGGGTMPIDKLKQLLEKYPTIGFVHTYGQTECSPRVTALLPGDSIKKIGSVGKPIPRVEVQVFDNNDNPLPNNSIGELVVRGSNTMAGYFKRDDITNQTIRNGWLHTGDLGYYDEEGYFYLTGRIKNIIICGGVNIYPEEIEQLLMQHKSVEEVCVVGEYHSLLGEVPIAKIVKKGNITSLALRQYCSTYIADYKIPVRFDFVESLPRTYNGKIRRY